MMKSCLGLYMVSQVYPCRYLLTIGNESKGLVDARIRGRHIYMRTAKAPCQTATYDKVFQLFETKVMPIDCADSAGWANGLEGTSIANVYAGSERGCGRQKDWTKRGRSTKPDTAIDQVTDLIRLPSSRLLYPRRVIIGVQSRGYGLEFTKISYRIEDAQPLASLKASVARMPAV
jgi:hypothetical protein